MTWTLHIVGHAGFPPDISERDAREIEADVIDQAGWFLDGLEGGANVTSARFSGSFISKDLLAPSVEDPQAIVDEVTAKAFGI